MMASWVVGLIGAVLTLVGIVGFVSGPVLLVFGINPLHNFVHLASGILGLLAAGVSGGRWASLYARAFGIIYVMVALLGFVAPGLMASLLAINMPDNWLHLGLGIVLSIVGFGMPAAVARRSG